MLHGMGLDDKGRDKTRECFFVFLPSNPRSRFPFCKGLPKPLREALQFLASNREIGLLTASLQDQLVQANPNAWVEVEPAPVLDLDLDLLPNIKWSEGVEEFNKMSEDELWSMLALPDKVVPFFNTHYDPDDHHDPWTHNGREWFKITGNGKLLALRWHQLVAVVKLLINVFAGKGTPLMDNVGLRKTIVDAAFIVILSYYRKYYEVHKHYPGCFGVFIPNIF
jgi:hypothetical protein